MEDKGREVWGRFKPVVAANEAQDRLNEKYDIPDLARFPIESRQAANILLILEKQDHQIEHLKETINRLEGLSGGQGYNR